MSKKFIAIISLFLMLLLVVSLMGCGKKATNIETKQLNENQEQRKQARKKVEPKTDPINEEQKKNPLQDGVKPYTGIIKKVNGSEIVIDIEGVDYDFKVTDKTNLQKGAEAGKGKLEELKPQMKINVLVQGGVALAVHYE